MGSTEPGTLGFASLNLSEPGRKKFTPDFLKGGRDRTRFILRQSNFVSRSERLAALAVRHPVPTVFENREFIAAGGLMGYGGSFADTYRLAGIYVARTLKGEKSLASCRSSRVRKLKCS